MFKHIHRSFLDSVLKAEREQFQQSVTETFVTTQNTDHFFEGNVLYKIPFKRSSVTTLLSDFNTICVEPTNQMGNQSAYPLLKEVSNQFLNIQAKAPFQECMQIIHPYQVNAGKHFYGALLRSTSNPDIIINPFHILTAVSVLSSEYVNHEFNILLYFYGDRDYADTTYQTNIAQADKIDNNLNALMHSFTSKLSTDLKVDTIHHNEEHDEVCVIHKERKYEDEDPDYTHFIVAHQLLTRGIIAPYYGSSLIQWNNNRTTCVGISLSPFDSVNISGRDSISTNNDSNNSASAVCTGNLTSTTLHGLRSLTHANLSSPYQEYTLKPGLLAYADAMVEKATALYINAGIITPHIKTDPMKDFTEEELACTTLLEFVKLRKKDDKKQIPLSDLKAQYTAMLSLKSTPEAPTIEEQESTHTLTYLDGTPISMDDRLVYTNKKSGRRISSILIALTEGILISREIASGRLVKHSITNVEQHDSIIVDGTRVFTDDYIECLWNNRLTTLSVRDIRHTEPQALSGGTQHIRNLSNITIRNL